MQKNINLNLSAVNPITFNLNLDNGWWLDSQAQNNYNLAQVNVFLYSDLSGINWFQASSYYTSWQTGNNVIELDKSDFSTGGGSPSWDTIKMVRFQFLPHSGETSTFTISSFTANKQALSNFVLTHDDSGSYIYSNAFKQFLQPLGISGTIFVCSNHTYEYNPLGGYMTLAQHQEMKAAGWSFGLHSVYHNGVDLGYTYNDPANPYSLLNMSYSQIYSEFSQNLNYLTSNNLILPGENIHAAMPNGVWSATIAQVMKDLGVKTVRPGVGGNQANPMINELYNIHPVQTESSTNISATLNYLSRAARTNSNFIHFTHQVYSSRPFPGNDNYGILFSDYQTLVNQAITCQNNGQLIIRKNMDDFYKGLTTPRGKAVRVF